MRIDAIALGTLDIPLFRPFKTALRTTASVRTAVVRVRADGLECWGECPPTPAITGDTWEDIAADLVGASSRLRGASGSLEELVDALGRLGLRTASARAALDIALRDGDAQTRGVPLWRTLTEQPTATGPRAVVTDVTVSVDDPDTMAAQASELVARGFAVLKVKVGTDAALDPERLRAVRAAAPEAVLRADANQGWTADEAIELIRGFEDDGIGLELVEQPVARHDLAGLKRVTDAVATPILADEAVFSAEDAHHVIDERAADLINVKLMKTGGLTEALKVASLAEEAGVGCMVGAMMESPISIAAAAHLAAARGCFTMADLDPPLLCAGNPVRGGIAYDGARIVLSDGPGLAIDGVQGVEWWA
ncbi:dipeptide epimerase [Nigerium massiliense]|uniref:dipeptide epimerase n=1 Tax=Nigerium massiliense TaxID=1522317 RepID=UPI00058FF2CA|nr:dipeptide epimerase [Nigerium massiliense]